MAVVRRMVDDRWKMRIIKCAWKGPTCLLVSTKIRLGADQNTRGLWERDWKNANDWYSQDRLIATGAYPGFCSMKRLEVFLLPLDGMLVHRRSNDWYADDKILRREINLRRLLKILVVNKPGHLIAFGPEIYSFYIPSQNRSKHFTPSGSKTTTTTTTTEKPWLSYKRLDFSFFISLHFSFTTSKTYTVILLNKFPL